MKIESIVYDLATKKWSVPTLPSGLDSERTLLFVSGPAEVIDHASPLAELVRAFPRSFIIGCGTAGSAAVDTVRDGVIAVTIVEFSNTTMSLAQAPVTATSDAFSVGQQIAKKLSKPSLRGVLVVGDGLEVDGAELVRGLNSALDQSIAMFGGLSGDGTRFKRTWVLAGPTIKSGLVAAVGMYGEHVVVTQSNRYGWKKVGAERTVTRSDGRIIYELDGRPALDVYEEAILAASQGGTGVTPIMLPLAVRATARHDKSLVRSVMGVEAQKRCLRLAVDVPQGYLVQTLVGDRAALVSASREAAVAAQEGVTAVGSDAFVFAVSHAGRRAVLGANASEEIASAVTALAGGPTAHVAGFYGYGEITATAPGHSDLHNQSIAVAVVMESPTPIARKATRGLAAGAARAQAPSNSSGPAAHLRSRHQTVDDLFLELELEGGKRGAPRAPGVPPPVPPRRIGAGASSSSNVATASAAPQARSLPASQSPPHSTRQPVNEPEEKTSPSLRPSEIPEHTRSRVKTPRVVDVPRDLQFGQRASSAPTGPSTGFALRSVTYSASTRSWSLPTLPEGDSPNTLVLAFGLANIGDKSGPLEDLAHAYPQSHILGCGASRLLRGSIRTEGDLLVTVARFERTGLHTAWADLATGSFAAGAALGQQLLKPELRAIIVVGDGAAVEGDALLGGLVGSVPDHVAISGGFTPAEAKAWVMASQIVKPGIVAAIGLYGKHLVVGRATRSGFEPFGPERHATRASGRTLYELDGKSALSVYAEYLGQKLGDLTAGSPLPFPVSCRVPDRAEPIVRMPVSFDPHAQSLTFAGDVPSGSIVRLMRASPERLLNEARAAATAAAKPLAALTSDTLVLAVSSIGRAKALGDEDVEETVSVMEGLPSDRGSHVTGFYAVAELGPNAAGRTELSNESLSLTCISERPEGAVLAEPTSERRTTPAPPIYNPAETPSMPQVARTATRSAPRVRHEITRPVISGVGTGAANAKITKARKGDVMVVTLAGRLSESFKGDALGRELSGVVVFDLGGVERITSFGVREWLQMLAVSQERVKKIYFAHCSEAVVNQLSMIRKFAGSAQVVSFFAPYLCDSCGEQFERLFDCELDADPIRSSETPESVCQRCNGRGRFDDDPETYLAFAPNHVGQPIPANVRAVLEELDSQAPAPTADAIEKTIDGETTRVRVQSKLGAAIRWQRILDGIEGALVIDLGGVAALDDVGVANFLHALNLGPEVDSIRLERCPQPVLEKFAELGAPKRVSIASTVVAGFCASCNVQRPALLVPDQHAHALGTGMEPVLNCKRCNGALSLVDARVVVQFLSRQRLRPSLAPRASTPAPAQVAPAPVPSVPVEPVAAASMAPAALPAAPRGGRSVLIGAAILSLAILLSAGFFAYARTRVNAEPEAAPAQKSAPTPSWSPLADLPPPWVERPFVEENNMLLILGRSEKAPNAEAALAQARSEAIGRVLRQLQTDLAGGPTHEFLVSRQPKDEDIKKRTASIAERYLRQVGTFAQPDRGETVVRQREGGIEAFARYRLSRTAYAQALATYKGTATLQGMTVARAFPTLDAPGTADLVVIAVAKGRPADAAGIKVGDFVSAAAQKPVSSVEQFGKLSDDWNQVPPGQSLDIEIENGAGRSTAKLRKPYPVAPVAPPPAATPHRDPQPTQRSPKDLGIIPPPRNF